ncbi:bacteriocin immunity protein [Patulibacter sp. NPDC049589]|uniref:bacteriocin immunity protein n=1 Tax=Patulibacter sp. NPDC049589 TaxID=3154731 RepID=UPI003427C9C4
METKELIKIVERIQSGDYESDEELDAMVDLFVRHVAHPAASDLIFHPQVDPRTGQEPSAAEIVRQAQDYRAIEL